MGMTTNFFLWCSGTCSDTVRKFEKPEIIRLSIVGAFVLLTAIMALMTSTYAIFDATKSLFIAVPTGWIWALIIFNLDRYIVTNIPIYEKRNTHHYKKSSIFPRVILASMIGVIIGTPFEMYLFREEITNEVRRNLPEKRTAEITNETSFLSSSLNTFQVNLASLEQSLITQSCSELIKEVKDYTDSINRLGASIENTTQGKDNSGKGCGKICKGLMLQKENIQKALPELQESKNNCIAKTKESFTSNHTFVELSKSIDETKKKIAEATNKITQRYNHFIENPTFLTQYDNFSNLKSKNSYNNPIFFISLFISLLFVIIEILPIIAKHIAGPGEYELYIHNKKISASNASSLLSQELLTKLNDQKNIQSIVSSGLSEANKKYTEHHSKMVDVFAKKISTQIENALTELDRLLVNSWDFSALSERIKQSFYDHVSGMHKQPTTWRNNPPEVNVPPKQENPPAPPVDDGKNNLPIPSVLSKSETRLLDLLKQANSALSQVKELIKNSRETIKELGLLLTTIIGCSLGIGAIIPPSSLILWSVWIVGLLSVLAIKIFNKTTPQKA